MLKKAAAAVAFACWIATPSNAQVLNGDTYGLQNFGSWSGVYVKKGNDSRFRAYTSGEGNWGITIDVMPPNCSVMLAIVLTMNGDSLQQDIAPLDFYGSVRVDQGEIWNLKFNTQGAMGDKSMIYTAYAVDGFPKLVSEMRDGQTLRAKLMVNGHDYYSTYQLNGFGSTFDAESATCRAFAKEKTKPQAKPSGTADKFL